MKNTIQILLLTAVMMISCSKDEINSESIFKEEAGRRTEFDEWLMRNYVEPFNIRFEYRMPDRESNFSYWVSPPNVSQSIMIAKAMKFTTIDAMVEMMSNENENEDPALFVKKYFPKVIYLVGSFEISNTGVTNLASAENGLQINILGANFFKPEVDAARIGGLMLHEFTHILDGTYAAPAEFKEITPDEYVGSRYSTLGNDYLSKGYVSNYARSSFAEDIAETTGRLISEPASYWDRIYSQAGEDGAAKLRKKHDLLKNWLLTSYKVDSDRWRDIYFRRLSELNNIDWNNLDD